MCRVFVSRVTRNVDEGRKQTFQTQQVLVPAIPFSAPRRIGLTPTLSQVPISRAARWASDVVCRLALIVETSLAAGIRRQSDGKHGPREFAENITLSVLLTFSCEKNCMCAINQTASLQPISALPTLLPSVHLSTRNYEK